MYVQYSKERPTVSNKTDKSSDVNGMTMPWKKYQDFQIYYGYELAWLASGENSSYWSNMINKITVEERHFVLVWLKTSS